MSGHDELGERWANRRFRVISDVWGAGDADTGAMTIQNAEEASLSRRQAEIAQMVVGGKSTREIAFALTLSPRTVETHMAAIYKKYDVSSRAELIAAVLGPGARTNDDPAVASGAFNTTLPARRAGLLGRATDVTNLLNLVRESRLVTVTGAGGVGKTRVALAVGEALRANVEAGLWFVDLAPLTRGSSVADAIVRAMSIEPSPGVLPIDVLRLQLTGKALIIILDNCEHLVTEAATVADALLRDCRNVRILATSRESLRIAGERTYRLPSLWVPPSGDSLVLDAVQGRAYASIQLFTQRAQAVDFSFTLTDENVPFVADICRRVDGIPLAIELAAARITILPVSVLAAQLDSHLRILGGGNRVALPRHQTMRALIDWSYDLLEPAQQRLFERLSVFSGGCALSEVIAVYGEDTATEVVMLDMLASLVDKSLVVVDATGPQPRYGLLQTFAHYGLDKLAARGDAAAVAHRHAVAYLHLAERLEAEYDAAPSTSWFARAQRDVANWRRALVWALEQRHDVLLGQRLVAALRPVWFSIEGAQESLRLARELIDEHTPPSVAAGLFFASVHVNLDQVEPEDAVADCRRLRDLYEKLGDPLRAAYLQAWEGRYLVILGRVPEAEPLIARALAVARAKAQIPLTAYILGIAAQVSFRRGDFWDGRAKYAEAIALYESIDAENNAALFLAILAEAEFGRGNIEQALQIATRSLSTIRRFGVKTSIALVLTNLAAYCIAADRWAAAHAHAREAVKLMQEMHNHMFLLFALQHVAAVAALAPSDIERRSHAARLIGYTDACLVRLGYARESHEKLEYERVCAVLRRTYTEQELGSQLASGAAMPADQAIELAMSI